MAEQAIPDVVWHKAQIDAYTAIKPIYDKYAAALERVFTVAKSASIPECIVQVRAKAIPSFAEKCLRKYEKHKDPVNELNDLCGARVIVHTLEQVKAVRAFVRCNFLIREEDEKGLILGEDKFGYRDLHFLILLDPARAAAIGFTADEIKVIGSRVAELQVRTVVQHAWADILHDRMYKTKLVYPPTFKRKGSLLAAIMEDGDRQFDSLAGDIDGMQTNFTVYASCQEVDKEIKILEVIYENAKQDKKSSAALNLAKAALNLAKLYSAKDRYEDVCARLKPHQNIAGSLRFEILLELGYALCKQHAAQPASPDYQAGQDALLEVIDECRCEVYDSIPNLRKRQSMLARALTRLGWSYQNCPNNAAKARSCYCQALCVEPGNPYYLAEVLAYEIFCSGKADMISTMEATIREAIATCRQHAANGVELPYAYFTAGRLQLLLGCDKEGPEREKVALDHDKAAVVDYAHGLRLLKTGDICVPSDLLEQEKAWIHRVAHSNTPTHGKKWVLDLIDLYTRNGTAAKKTAGETKLAAPVMIVAGSAGIGITSTDIKRLTENLADAVAGCRGCILSGGTPVGVPGAIAQAVMEASSKGQVPELVSYLPRSLPTDLEADKRYRMVICGENDFSPAQPLQYWRDILANGVAAKEVVVFGYGGGLIAAAEYAIALMLGAEVYLVRGSGRAADDFLQMEALMPNLKGLPNDKKSILFLFRSASPAPATFTSEELDRMARQIHANYVEENAKKIPENLRHWDRLDDNYRQANIGQAQEMAEILHRHNFAVVPQSSPGVALTTDDMNQKDQKEFVEKMAELEHGRWNVDRLKKGWRHGERDNEHKVHDCLVPWDVLPDQIREFDREAIRNYPGILANVGMKIVKLGD